MAALYLHNASPQSHNRQLSNVSTRDSMRNSIQTVSDNISTGHPLLRDHSTTDSYGEINRNASSKEHRGILHIGRGWGDLNRSAKFKNAPQNHWSVKLAKIVQLVLEIVIAVWAIYTTVRYFLAYASYTSSEGQAISLAMGTITTVSFALLLAERILAASVSYLASQGLPADSLHSARLVLRTASSVLLAVPAITAFVLTFVWRDKEQSELSLNMRCHLDVDIVWSFSLNSQCNRLSPDIWLGLATVRLFLTAVVIAMYHYAVVFGHRNMSTLPSELHRSEAYVTQFTALPPSFRASPDSFPQSSQSIIAGSSSPPSGRNRSLRRSRSQSTITSSSRVELAEAMTPLDSFSPYSSFPASATSSPPPSLTDDRDLHSFVDRIRSLVSQVSIETDEGIRMNPEPVTANFDDIYGFGYDMTTAPPSQTQMSYRDEFGTSTDHVRVLGSYIRRMPTIESMGSHEVTSIHDHHRQRLTSTSTSGYSSPVDGPSRANSLATSSHLSTMYQGISENAAGEDSQRPSLSIGEISGSNSRSTTVQSYHTAYVSSGSAPSSPLHTYTGPDEMLSTSSDEPTLREP